MKTDIPVGIDQISFYSPRYYIELRSIATARGLDPDTFINGLGQEKMAVPPPGEDIVTMAANAAASVMDGVDRQAISTLIFATESGIDQSKAGGYLCPQALGASKTLSSF